MLLQSGCCHAAALLFVCHHWNGTVLTLPAQKLLQVRCSLTLSHLLFIMPLPLDSFGKGVMFSGCRIRSFIWTNIVTMMCQKWLEQS